MNNNLLSKIKGTFESSLIDAIHKFITFGDFFIALSPRLLKLKVKQIRKKQEKTIKQLKNKEKIKTVFLIQTHSTWKFDKLYRLMEKSKKFEPLVVVCPYCMHFRYSKKQSLKMLEQTENFVKNQGYNFISSYNKETGKWLNIRKTINPDVVFFTRPYKDTLPNYYIHKFSDKITCYANYGFCCINSYRLNFNLPFNNLLYHFFAETDYQKEFAIKYSTIKGANAITTGFPGIEPLIDGHTPENIWKPQNKTKKKIIWAPHHSLNDFINTSNFLIYCDFMLEIAKKYENEIQFAFKPHPVLKFKLLNLWGEEKTNNYYNIWNNLPNTQIEEGYYIDLFLTSDAMLHDCASFTAEYFHTLKPVAYIIKNLENNIKQLNPFGEKLFNLHYHVYNQDDIEGFIQNTVLQNNDTMFNRRKEFFDECLYPKDGILPSQKILNVLCEELG